MGLTANTFESDKQRCLQAGMDDVKCKPISRDALLERISLVHRASLMACGGTRLRSASTGKGMGDGGAERGAAGGGAAGGGAAAGAAGAPGHRHVAQLDQAMRTAELNLLSGARWSTPPIGRHIEPGLGAGMAGSSEDGGEDGSGSGSGSG